MSSVLVAYSTNAGSTAETAAFIAGELNRLGHTAEAKAMQEVNDLAGYDGVIVGAPMIFGWHAPARQFVKKFEKVLANKKVAYFSCAMRLTVVPGEKLADLPLWMDPALAAAPQKAGRLSIKERFTTTGYYLKPMLEAATAVKPLSVAFFNGKLVLFNLKWWQAAFVMIVIRAKPGDYRDWDNIGAWVKSIRGLPG